MFKTKTPKGADTQARIFDAALALFRTRGFEATTMRDVAEAAELSLGAAYHYFSSKEAIVLAYYTRVQDTMGGAAKTAEFARLFLAPGVGHCGGGAGPTPSGQLDALVAWVERGTAPATLPSARRDQTGAVTRSRPLCPYPQVAKYNGTGSTDDAANFSCSAGF